MRQDPLARPSSVCEGSSDLIGVPRYNHFYRFHHRLFRRQKWCAEEPVKIDPLGVRT